MPMEMVVCKLKCWVDEEKSFKKLRFNHLSIDLNKVKLHFQKKSFPEYPAVYIDREIQNWGVFLFKLFKFVKYFIANERSKKKLFFFHSNKIRCILGTLYRQFTTYP